VMSALANFISLLLEYSHEVIDGYAKRE
jgi:hypothetical protein